MHSQLKIVLSADLDNVMIICLVIILELLSSEWFNLNLFWVNKISLSNKKLD